MTVALAAALWACGLPPARSNTGFQGTWSRGTERARSIVAIARAEGGGYLVRVRVVSDDHGWDMDCGWDGACACFSHGVESFVYRLTSRVDAATGALRIAFDGHAVGNETRTDVFVDACTVAPDGLALTCETLERNGTVFPPRERPRRIYEKVADAVAIPARAGAAR